MPRYASERLSALDTSFLVLEGPNAGMHVASTMVFESGPLATTAGGVDAGGVRRHVAGALPRIPRSRQKLAWPLVGNPLWIDDTRSNLDDHVRHTALPRPGNDAQLKRPSGRIMQQQRPARGARVDPAARLPLDVARGVRSVLGEARDVRRECSPSSREPCAGSWRTARSTRPRSTSA